MLRVYTQKTVIELPEDMGIEF